MKDKLQRIKEALQHSIRIMEEEVYVTRDQERALILLDSMIAELDSSELVEKVAKIMFITSVSNATDASWRDFKNYTIPIAEWYLMTQAAINAIKG